MKKFYFLTLLSFAFTFVTAQTQPGDISFIAFNADGSDDFAFVTFVDIPANTTIYFTDNEATSTGSINSGEGILVYTSPASLIDAGTVIVINDASIASRSANLGTITSDSGSFNLAAGGDVIYAYIGAPTSPTVFLAGIQNEANNEGDLAGSGLVEGDTFFTFTASGNPDGGQYIGTRENEAAFTDYRPLINDLSNWTTYASDGELILPIDATAFTVPPLSNKNFETTEFSVYPNPVTNGFVNIKTTSNDAINVTVFDVLGKQVVKQTLTTNRLNVSNLKAGMYLLNIEQNGASTTKKLVIE